MEKYGPNTEAVEALIEKVKTITPEQAKALEQVCDVSDDTSFQIAIRAIHDTCRSIPDEEKWRCCRDGANGVILDAVVGLIVKDLIFEDDFNTLYGPWASVMEEQGNE